MLVDLKGGDDFLKSLPDAVDKKVEVEASAGNQVGSEDDGAAVAAT